MKQYFEAHAVDIYFWLWMLAVLVGTYAAPILVAYIGVGIWKLQERRHTKATKGTPC